jgi:hypothetical protein
MSWAKTTLGPPSATAWLAILVWLGGAASAPAVPGSRSCSATITGSFADACREFTAHSTKDISYVELHYANGRVVRRRSINRRDWAIDGGPGDEIDLARVKSGTTIEEFACEPANTAPTARLEILTPPIDQTVDTCQNWTDGLLCEQSSPRTAWTSPGQIPPNGSAPGFFLWGCGGVTDPSLCGWTVHFRGIGSADPDGDVVSWSLDFGDGRSARGTVGGPPSDLAHAFAPGGTACVGGVGVPDHVCIVTLTVTDSAGQSDSDRLLMVFLDQSPD